MARRRRPSIGRQKIEIRPIETLEARQVCFSKRRSGLFNKASELAILCGAAVATVVFSPAGKAFSFGHPSVEAVIDRFDPTGAAIEGAGAGAGEEGEQLAELHRQQAELRERLDAAKAKKNGVEASMANLRAAASPAVAWLEANLSDMGEKELMAFAAKLPEVQAAVAASTNQLLLDGMNHGGAMAAGNGTNMFPVMAPQQQVFGMGAGGNAWTDFGAGTSANNGAEIDMLMMSMTPPAPPPPPGSAVADMEMMLEEEFGPIDEFFGPY